MTATASAEAELGAFFAADPQVIAWPYELYERWQQGEGAIWWEGGPALVVTRHRDVKAVMSGEHPLANNAYRHGRMAERTLASLPPATRASCLEILDFESLFMSRHDGAEHQRLRRSASRSFTARRIARLRESIERHVDELVSAMAEKPTCDIRLDLANLLPVRVITDLLGVPQSDREMIWEWSEAIAGFFTVDAERLARAQRAVGDFRAYVRAMIAELRRSGEGPELARVLLSGRSDEALSENELVAMYLLILFGGSETTTNLLANGFLALQRNRAQWDDLVAHPELVAGAVEEMLRYDSPHHYLPRYATADFEIAGQHVSADDTVIIVQGAANRDPEVFEHPAEFDIRRPNSREHLSFAFGPHYCLGAALARLEGEVVFSRLVREFPGARLTADELSYHGSAMLRAVSSLPTELGPRRR